MYYQTESLFPGLTRIWDIAHTAMYLVEGSERALLIDTGVGLQGLRAAVDSLTNKPLSVIITHGHIDHAMGVAEFADVPVYISPLDAPVYAAHSPLKGRKGYAEGIAAPWQPSVSIPDEHFLPVPPFETLLPLAPGDTFDLGGVTAVVTEGAGHTPGSVTVLIPEWRILILGDACNAFTYLFEQWCSSVADYREMLLRLKAATDGRYDRTLFSHGFGEGAPDMIGRVIAVCDDILAGQDDRIPHPGINGEDARLAKAMNFEQFRRVDGGEGNILYDHTKL